MPWTGKTFKKKHDKELTDSQAKKAAEIANEILSSGEDEGVAIATAIKLVKNKPKKGVASKKKDGVKEKAKYKPKKIEKREDVNPKEGAKKYGAVQFADPVNKKYPLHDEEHIRAAWNYIHQDKNAAKYAPEEVDLIKSRIVRAWKKKIDKEGPPAAQETKEQTKVKK
jgi:uncharacterized protein YdaT